MNAEPILELRDVAVPARRDVDTISFEVAEWTVQAGDFWVVGGPQNSGKSDLIFMLAGLIRPLRGRFTLFGEDMTKGFGEELLACRRRLGMVFDDARLFNHLTMAENVSLPARYHNDLHADEADAWSRALLSATDLKEFADVTPGLVSANWRRRAALARALALRPDLVLLENPLRGLDARHAIWWVDFVTRLWKGHDVLGGRPVTVILTADEFLPWRESGARFVTLDQNQFTVAGEHAPEEAISWSRAPINKGS